jgi:hypothetical protein
MLLKFTGNDYEGALRILKSVDKDINIIKGKFIGQNLKIYGTFIIIFNGKLKEIENVEIVIKFEDKSAIEFDFDKNWADFVDDVSLYLKKNITEVNSQEKFLNLIKSQRTIYFLDSRLTHKKEINDEEMNNFFKDLLATIIGDVNVALKMKFEKTDIFEISKSKSSNLIELLDEEDEVKIEKKEKKEESFFHQPGEQFLLLKIETELAPINGKSLSKLNKGDLIGVRIIDDRPIAEYISGLLQAKNLGTQELKTVFAVLNDLKLTDEGIFLSVEFGPGIYGQAYFGEDVKVKVANGEHSDKSDKDDENFFSRHFWLVIFGSLLIIIFLFVIFLIL